MPTYRVKIGDGYGFLKGNLGPHCSCGGVTAMLCDYPVGQDKTCDKRLCRECGHHIGPDTDYCGDHFKEWEMFRESGGVVEVLQNVLPFGQK